MLQNNRNYTAGSTKYRYGFNGKENDNEIKGDGNQQDYGMRIYDPRVGRFLSVDPLTAKYPELTPYQFASNRPIDGIDLDGLEFANKTAENTYYHRSPRLNLPKPAPVTIPVSTSSIQASYKDNAYVKSGQQAAFVPSRVPEEHMAAPDTYRERGLIGPKSTVKEDLGISKQNYYNAVGDNIAGGPIGAGTYMFYGEKASFYGAAGDQMAFSFGGVSGEGFLSKPEFKGEANFIPNTSTRISMSNMEVRIWYNQQLNTINTNIAATEENAKLVSVQRNLFKIEARSLMADRKAASALDLTDPINSFDYYVNKYKADGYNGESLWKKIIESGNKPNVEVNKQFKMK